MRWIRRILPGHDDAGWEMSVQSHSITRGTSVRLSDAVHVLAALAAGLLPLMVFAVLSYHQTMRRAEADLTETVEVARRFVQDLLQQAELELTRFVQVTDGRVTPESKKLLREVVYTNPYFREAGIVDEQGFLVHSTAAEIETPIEIPPDQRSDAVKSMQIVGLVQTSIMREKSIVLRLSTRGQGRGQCSGRSRSADPPLPRCRAWSRGELASRRSQGEGIERAQPPCDD